MYNSALLIPELLEDGIRLLAYAGNAGKHDKPFICSIWLTEACEDLLCNYMASALFSVRMTMVSLPGYVRVMRDG